MKELALGYAAAVSDPVGRMNMLREYVQASVLRSLHESRAFGGLSFVGGTALRFIFSLPRFSEDLDFSLESGQGYEPERWMAKLKRDLLLQGFETAITWNARKTVHVAWVRMSGLLQEAGIVTRREQNLSVKIKIDTKPPAGASMETRLVDRYGMFALRHHNLPSLMSGKVHALCSRPYEKGRDWYDLVWYRTRQPPVEPNSVLLSNAMAQTGTAFSGDWRSLVAARAEAADFAAIRADVDPFLERRSDAGLLERELVLGCLGKN